MSTSDGAELVAAIEAPRTTPTLVGHAAAWQTFVDAFAGGRLAHAWLITGPAGVGKATLAWRLARHVLAAEGGAGQGADALIDAGAHPDCRHIHRTPAPTGPARLRTEITVNDIRALGPFLRQTPAHGGWRVAIVDTADELNINASNALLKLLEEPPARALLLVLAHAPARLLPTIRSRCRHLPLHPLDPAEMRDLIAPLVDSPEAAATLAQLADGCPGRALALAEQDGLATYATLLSLLSGLPDFDGPAVMALAGTFGGARGEPAYRTFVDLLQWWLRDLIRRAATEPPNAWPDLNRRLLGTPPPLEPRRLERWLDLWENTRDLVDKADRANLDRKQVILQIFFDLADAATPHAR